MVSGPGSKASGSAKGPSPMKGSGYPLEGFGPQEGPFPFLEVPRDGVFWTLYS